MRCVIEITSGKNEMLRFKNVVGKDMNELGVRTDDITDQNHGKGRCKLLALQLSGTKG